VAVEVSFPPSLRRHFPVPARCTIEARTAAEAVAEIDRQFPGVAAYLIHENGALRPHVNLFLDERFIADRERLSDSLAGVRTLTVMQALSGG
jgi:molybdopterin synthase sulfur carrier subunit